MSSTSERHPRRKSTRVLKAEALAMANESEWRWLFPRGIDLVSITQAEVDHADAIINGHRRRNLDYQSPASIYAYLTLS